MASCGSCGGCGTYDQCYGGCSGSCVGTCQGCQGCTGTCYLSCEGCEGCSGCSGTCNQQCNSGCQTEANGTAFAALTLDTYIKSSDLTNIRAVVIAAAKRAGSDISATPTYPQGNKSLAESINNLTIHLKNLGHDPGQVQAGDKMTSEYGLNVIEKAKDAYAHVRGV